MSILRIRNAYQCVIYVPNLTTCLNILAFDPRYLHFDISIIGRYNIYANYRSENTTTWTNIIGISAISSSILQYWNIDVSRLNSA